MKMVIASHNPGKIREFAAALGTGNELVGINEFSNGEPEENGSSLYENAKIKADYALKISSLPSFADDTGLFVDALGGRPGIHAARYGNSDTERIGRLLGELKGVPYEKRTAHFSTCIAYADGVNDFWVEGTCFGHIALEPAGQGGFGYDPVFIPDGQEKPFSLFSPEEKTAISHRGKAIVKFVEKLKKEGLI